MRARLPAADPPRPHHARRDATGLQWLRRAESTMNSEVLNSWKEIAAYLGRGVRTVQRWENELGLPVRRPRAKHRSAVIALKPEIDNWLKRYGQAMVDPVEGRTAIKKSRTALAVNVKRLREQTQQLLERFETLRKSAMSLTNVAGRTTGNSPKR